MLESRYLVRVIEDYKIILSSLSFQFIVLLITYILIIMIIIKYIHFYFKCFVLFFIFGECD